MTAVTHSSHSPLSAARDPHYVHTHPHTCRVTHLTHPLPVSLLSRLSRVHQLPALMLHRTQRVVHRTCVGCVTRQVCVCA